MRLAAVLDISKMLLRDKSDLKYFMSALELHGIKSIPMGSFCGVGFDCKSLMKCSSSIRGDACASL